MWPMVDLCRARQFHPLMSYGPNLADAFGRLGLYVGKVLRGARPAELPVEAGSPLRVVLNLKTARTLGLKTQPTPLALADEVIESNSVRVHRSTRQRGGVAGPGAGSAGRSLKAHWRPSWLAESDPQYQRELFQRSRYFSGLWGWQGRRNVEIDYRARLVAKQIGGSVRQRVTRTTSRSYSSS